MPGLAPDHTAPIGGAIPRLLINHLLRAYVALIEINEGIIGGEESDLPQIARRSLAIEVRLSLRHPVDPGRSPAIRQVLGSENLEWSFLTCLRQHWFPVDFLDRVVIRRVREDDRDHDQWDQDQGKRADHVARARLTPGTRHVTYLHRPHQVVTAGNRRHCEQVETIETIAHHHGPRGEVVLRRRVRDGGDVEELIINGVIRHGQQRNRHERLLAELALPSGRAHRVLVGGLGLGYTVAALSALEVDAIDVVEIEQCLIDWAYQGIAPSIAAAASDPRVQLHAGDIRLVLAGVIEELVGPWDAIVLDVDNGPDFLIHPHNRALYTEESLRAAYAQLAPGGTLAIWCQGPAPALRAVLEHIGSSVEEHIIDVSRGERSFAYAIYTVSRGQKPQQES